MELKRQLKSKFYNLKKDFLLLKESIPNNVPEIKHKPRISENISNKQILDKNEDIQSQLSEIKQKLEKLQ
jgi:hypothetical protein